jgi:hypothetical protein
MKKEEFVAAIKSVVLDVAPKDVIKQIEKPSGKATSAELLNLSKWYGSLSPEDKQNVFKLANMVSRTAVLGFMGVLDGVRAIENEKEKGELRLLYKKGNTEVDFSDQSQPFFYEILNSNLSA